MNTQIAELGVLVPADTVTLRPHQQEAFDKASQYLGEHDRVTVVLPCGTGKTILGQQLAQSQARHGRSAILVLLPSLALLSQTLKVWNKHSRRQLAPFAFCSDPSISSEDLPVPVSTKPADLAAWVSRTSCQIGGPQGPQMVVFSTYHSSPRIAEAHRLHGLGAWHAVVADEAHCSAGDFESAFSTVVDDRKIPAAVRIFLTATRRIRDDVQAAAFCMDNPDAFGPVVDTLPVPAAIVRQLLSDYQVVVVAVTDKDVRQALSDSGSDGAEARPATETAVQVAVLAAAKKYGLRRMMVFHNDVAASRHFTETLVEAAGKVNKVNPAALVAMHVDAKTKTRMRAGYLEVLSDPGHDQVAVLSNVRCLGQGIDVPALDGVVFGAPRTSTIDITQCVGRALRRDPDRSEPAVIVLPAFVDDEHDLASQVSLSRFRHVYRTLLALADMDSSMVGSLSSRRRSSQGSSSGGDGSRLEIMASDGSPGPQELLRALSLRTLKLLTPGWDFGFSQLQMFVAEHGHCRIPTNYVTPDGFGLWSWARGNRQRRELLTDAQRNALDSVDGWQWNLHDAAWQAAYERLAEFAAAHGHCRVPQGYYCEDGFLLTPWAPAQRFQYQSGTLAPERALLLSRLAGWSWDPHADNWETGFEHLVAFVEKFGHAAPPYDFRTEDGYPLGTWCGKQRQDGNADRMTVERRDRLKAQPGWQWDLREARWHAGLIELRRFRAEFGHTKVPARYVSASGYPLGRWLNHQRSDARIDKLSDDRFALMDAEGVDWDPGQGAHSHRNIQVPRRSA